MKKLMITVAIVCAAIVSQAASFDWKVGAIAINDGSGASKATTITDVYLFNATDYSQATLLADLNEGDTFANIQANALAKGTLSSGKMSTAVSLANTGTFGTSIATYIAVFADDKVFINTSANTTVKSDPDVTHITANIAYMAGSKNTIDSATFSNAGWYTVNVPEPTSGLLLLIGMASLALRRRRA